MCRYAQVGLGSPIIVSRLVLSGTFGRKMWHYMTYVGVDIVNGSKRYILTRKCIGRSSFLDSQMIG
jgi:hypothetical protein